MSSGASRLTTQRITRLALLAAAAVVLGYIESGLAAMMALLPGIKLGLANTVLLYAIYLLGPCYAAILMVLKGVLTGFMSGNLAAAFFYSMGGGVLSLIMMLLVKRLGGEKISIVGVSVVGAVSHNMGQLLVAALMVQTAPLLYYIFPLLFSAVVTGIITGLAGKQIVRVLRMPGTGEGGKGQKKATEEDRKA